MQRVGFESKTITATKFIASVFDANLIGDPRLWFRNKYTGYQKRVLIVISYGWPEYQEKHEGDYRKYSAG